PENAEEQEEGRRSLDGVAGDGAARKAVPVPRADAAGAGIADPVVGDGRVGNHAGRLDAAVEDVGDRVSGDGVAALVPDVDAVVGLRLVQRGAYSVPSAVDDVVDAPVVGPELAHAERR